MDSGRRFAAAMCVILAGTMSAPRVFGQTAVVAQRSMADSDEGAQRLLSETTGDQLPGADAGDLGLVQSCYRHGWTVSADFIALERIGTVNQTLVTTYPGAPNPAGQYIVGQGTDQLHSSDLTQGFAVGPQVGLAHHGDCGYDLEASFFEIDGWRNIGRVASGAAITPIFVAPGTPFEFVQTTDHADQFMVWSYATKLYNAEFNLRWDLCSRVTMLAGFRWVNLSEELEGTLPPYRSVPFWDNTTQNNLCGFQIGEDWTLLHRGPLSINAVVKAGIFDNIATETTAVSIFQVVHRESASTNHAAFLGEIGAHCRYQLTQAFALTLGYQALWLEGVALAPGQISYTLSGTSWPAGSAAALGVDCRSGAFYHGATAGLECAF
jgi:hypothetical protein